MRLATLLVLAFAIAGCEGFGPVPPPPPPPPPPPVQPVPDLPEMTLKGPQEVTRGDRPMFKAEGMHQAVRYTFELHSGPTVLRSNDTDNDRYYFTDVVGEGRVEVRVTAYDADDTAIAFARRWVDSRF